MKLFACFAILAAFIAFSESSLLDSLLDNVNEDRIIRGQTATPGQFPYMVSLRALPRNNHFCGGSIISKRWVVSAVRCTLGRFAQNITIVVGAHHIRTDGTTHTLKRIVNHPKYIRAIQQNDISLLQTSTPILLNERVRVIPIVRKSVGGSVAAIVSGWGWSTFDPASPTHLQFLRVNTLTNEVCRARLTSFPDATHLVSSTICVFSQRGQGICDGDFGSPLTTNGKLTGVAIWISHQCAHGRPDGYTRVSLFVKWIQEVTGVRAV